MRAFLSGLAVAAVLMAGAVFVYFGAAVPVESRYSPEEAVHVHVAGEKSAMAGEGGGEARQQARK